MRTKTSKRYFLLGLSLAITAVSVLGCSNNKTDETADVPETQAEDGETLESGKVELRIWAEDSNCDNIAKMAESFKEEYGDQADFEITVEASPDADAKNIILSDIHNCADVFSMPDDQLYSLIAGGCLMPIPNQEEIRSANLEEAVEAASYNGTLYAYPYSADNGYFLYYDRNYLSEADVETLDGILSVAEKNGKHISMDLSSGWYLYTFFGHTGLEFGINEDGVTNHCSWNATEGDIKGVDIAKALLKITGNPAFLAQPDIDFINGVRSGEIIAGVSGVWNEIAIREAWGDDYGACRLPTYTCGGEQIQMASFTGYKMFGVNAYSAHSAWAHKLAEWLTNEENQMLRFEERTQGPSNKNAAASEEVKRVPAIAAVIEQSQFGTLQRVGNSYWDACTSFSEVITSGNPDNVPLQDLMDTLVKGITASVVQ